MSIKNVTITGAAGALGEHILAALASTPSLSVQILRRAGSSSTFPSHPSIPIVDADFSSIDSLASAFSGQDAIVSAVGHTGLEGQIPLIDAAIRAGVKRFIPSEFGSDLANPVTRTFPVFAEKIKVIEHLEGKAKEGLITYTHVRNNAFLDWGIEKNLILEHASPTPTLLDGGNFKFSVTALSTVGQAVATILSSKAEETKNRAVYIEDAKVSQRQVLQYAREVASGREWQPKEVGIDGLVAKAEEKFANGDHDFMTLVPFIYRAALGAGYGGAFEKTDNELLGLKGKTEAEIKEIVSVYVKP